MLDEPVILPSIPVGGPSIDASKYSDTWSTAVREKHEISNYL